MNNGKQLSVHFDKKICSDKLLYRTDKLNGIPVKVTPHRTLNYSRCVIWCKELAGMDEEDIQKELQSQGVTEVERMKRRKDLAQRKVSPLEEYWRSPALVSRSMISSEPYLLTTWPSASVEALFMPLKDISNMQWTLSKGGHYRMASNLLCTSARYCTLQHQDASLNDSPTL